MICLIWLHKNQKVFQSLLFSLCCVTWSYPSNLSFQRSFAHAISLSVKTDIIKFILHSSIFCQVILIIFLTILLTSQLDTFLGSSNWLHRPLYSKFLKFPIVLLNIQLMLPFIFVDIVLEGNTTRCTWDPFRSCHISQILKSDIHGWPIIAIELYV